MLLFQVVDILLCCFLSFMSSIARNFRFSFRQSWHTAKYNMINWHSQRIYWDFEFQGLLADGMLNTFVDILLPLVDRYVPTSTDFVPSRSIHSPAAFRRSRKGAWQIYNDTRYERRSHKAVSFKNYNFFNFQTEIFIFPTRMNLNRLWVTE